MFKNLSISIKAILSLQSLGMLMGTSAHVAWVIENGFNSNQYNQPLLSRLFWDSLTFLDPLAVILLFLKPKTGLILVLSIISLDVIHNNYIYFEELYQSNLQLTNWMIRYWMIMGQFIFLIFVLSTFKKNLNAISNNL